MLPAVGSVIEHDQASQCATDFTSTQNLSAFVASNSPTSSNNMADVCADKDAAAAIFPANASAADLASAYSTCCVSALRGSGSAPRHTDPVSPRHPRARS